MLGWENNVSLFFYHQVNIVNGFRFYFSTSITSQRVPSMVMVQDTVIRYIPFHRDTTGPLVFPFHDFPRES